MLPSRGRSRHVSVTALARQASEERRSSLPYILSPIPVKAGCPPSFIPSLSPSPPSSASMSPDSYDLPASPQSLEDQVHVAYALDDIHLAKILLLRLKGIEVTSDDDPRIAAVQDEDFDICFVPNGRLMDDTDEKFIKEMQTKELERLEEKRRFERLRIWEKIWDEQKRKFREERLAVFRLRERKWMMEEEDRRRTADQQQKERSRIQKAALAEKAVQRTRARLVCYDSLPSTPEKRPGQQFVYDFMVHSSPARVSTPSLSLSRSYLCPPVFDDSRSVPFTAVLDSMQGPLFPVSTEDHIDSPSVSRSTSRTHSQANQRRQHQLLNALLVQVQWNEEERRNRKGKQRAHLRRSLPCPACSVISSPTSPTPSASSSISRTSSWLSFAASTSSSPTDSITPSTSPAPSVSSSKSGWFKSPLAPRPKYPTTTSNLHNPTLRHSCNLHSRSTPVLPSESPLHLNPTHSSNRMHSTLMSYHGRRRSTSTVRAAKEGAGLIVRRVSRFMEIAREFQQTYVNLALSNAPEPRNWEPGGERCRSTDVSDPNSSIQKSKLRAPGYRAKQRDVTAFLDVCSSEAGSSPSGSGLGPGSETTAASTFQDILSPPPPKYIPLTSPSTSDPPRTILPDPLPYSRVFQPLPVAIRSPFRCHALSELHTMYPSVSDPSPLSSYNPFLHQVTWRIRSVGNPVYLRLKALHNVMWKGGMVWEGRGRETALGGGRERVVGVAYDGIGRSSLSWEVKF
jgi:hypothetical protein